MSPPSRVSIPVGVLVAPTRGAPSPPEALPIGRAALHLAERGVDVVFGHAASDGRLTGQRAVPGGWVPVEGMPVVAAYDRYPSQTDPAGFERLVGELVGVPVHNPAALVGLCRDKLATQRTLEAAGLRLPEVETDPARFAERLEAWGSAYVKPRYGAFGRGVRRVVPGDDLPAEGDGAVPGRPEPLFLQRALPPPAGFRGVSVRVLCQRLADGSDADRRPPGAPDDDWHVEAPVARRSRTDWVVNAARGADVVPAEAVLPAPHRLVELALLAARTLDDGGLLEIGVDLVVDEAGEPWIVEVNGRPRGRLESLARRDRSWEARHLAACARPLRWLAARYGR